MFVSCSHAIVSMLLAEHTVCIGGTAAPPEPYPTKIDSAPWLEDFTRSPGDKAQPSQRAACKNICWCAAAVGNISASRMSKKQDGQIAQMTSRCRVSL